MIVESHYVWVFESVVDPQLVRKLLLHVVLFYRWLEDLLYRANESALFVNAQVDVSELAWTYAFPKLEISYLQSLRLLWIREEGSEQILLLFFLLKKARKRDKLLIAAIISMFLQRQRVSMQQSLFAWALSCLFPYYSNFFFLMVLLVTLIVH